VQLQTSLALLHGSTVTPHPPPDDPYDRKPFRHPALAGLDGLTQTNKDLVNDKNRLARLGENYGLDKVLRWKPKLVHDFPGLLE